MTSWVSVLMRASLWMVTWKHSQGYMLTQELSIIDRTRSDLNSLELPTTDNGQTRYSSCTDGIRHGRSKYVGIMKTNH